MFSHLDPAFSKLKPGCYCPRGNIVVTVTPNLRCFYLAEFRSPTLTGCGPTIYITISRRIQIVVIEHASPACTLLGIYGAGKLLKEGFAADIVKVTGNTVIDALLSVADQAALADIGGTGRLGSRYNSSKRKFW